MFFSSLCVCLLYDVAEQKHRRENELHKEVDYEAEYVLLDG